MSLASDYRRQLEFRAWREIFDALPPLAGRTVLDLGCGIGDQAAELVRRGARVVGFDGNEELLGVARARGLERAEFRSSDLGAFPDPGLLADGLWCSFSAAYFPELSGPLACWSRYLRPGGWIALTEVDDFFGHEPLDRRTAELLEAYARDALSAGRYDFHMGRKLERHLERCGFALARRLEVEDRELSFAGPALPAVLEAWSSRFERMPLLRQFCGPEFEPLRADFLACLGRTDHRSRARVVCCIATRSG